MGSIRDAVADRTIANFSTQSVEFNQLLAEIGGFALANLLAEFEVFTKPGPITNSPEDFRPSDEVLTVGLGGVVIEAVAQDGDGAALLAQLEALGLMFGGAYKNAVSGLFPIARLDELPGLVNLAFAAPSYSMTQAGSVENRADIAMNTDDLRGTFGIDGSGITVGILSDSFDTGFGIGSASTNYAADVASGDLPAGINVLEDFSGGGQIDEGRAMAQLIYDIAPGVDMEFATAFLGPASFAQNIQNLAVNSDVIVDDVFYLTQPIFQDGVIAQAVDTVFAQGKAYFSSAGNAADQSYESSARSTTGSVIGMNGEWHDFDPGTGVDLMQDFTLAPGQSVRLSFQWDEPYLSGAPGSAGSASDVDIALIDTDTNSILASGTALNVGADPFELIGYQNFSLITTQNVALAINYFSGPTPNVIKYVDFGSGAISDAEFATGSGASFGHSSAEGGLGVGAAFYQQTPEFGVSPPQLEDFSSLGDSPIYFDMNGNRLATPEIRERVDITAPDGTDTTFFGSNADDTPAPNFFGTSAAAPHAAALAALMLDADGTLTPTEIYDAMKGSAIDIVGLQNGTPTGVGYDNWSGHGLIDGPGAFAAAGIVLADLVVDIAIDESDGIFSAGDLSLREAIAIAQTTNQDIVFDGSLAGQTIMLDSGLGTLQISSGIFSINGNVDGDPAGIADITISGDAGNDDITRINTMGYTLTDAFTNTNVFDNVQVFGVSGGADVTLENIVLTGGSSQFGGAIQASGANLRLDAVTISGNEATTAAGGVFASDTVFVMRNSTVSENVAAFSGGGVYVSSSSPGVSSSIFNSTISGNQGGSNGGGIDHGDGFLGVYNSTITNNTASTGAGIDASYVTGAFTELFSTVVANNSGSGDTSGTSFFSSGSNLIGADGSGSFINGSNGDLVGTAISPVDPLLGSLGNNGGGTETHLPLGGSPVIDAGDNIFGLSEDQRGFNRTEGPFVDIGSVETAAQTDLIATNFTITGPAFLNGAITFDFDIDNIGDLAAGDFDAGVYFSTDPIVDTFDTFIGFIDIAPGLAPAGSTSETLDTTIPQFLAPGTYFAAVIADDLFEQDELSESNNVSNVIEIEVTTAPVTLLDAAGLGRGSFATIADAFAQAVDGNEIVVDPTSYTQPDEFVFAQANDLKLNLPAGVSSIVSLGGSAAVRFTVLGNGSPEIQGNELGNRLSGAAGADLVFGLGGNDTIKGLEGDDILVGGGNGTGLNSGDDFLSGRGGNDQLFGEDGNDTAYGGTDNDVVVGGQGNDSLFGGTGEDTIFGDGGNDTLVGQNDNDTLFGGTGEDNLVGGGGADSMQGGDNNDTLAGQAGNDTILGGEGADLITGKFGDDSIDGGGGADNIFAGAEEDTVNGGLGDDTIRGEGQDDLLKGDGGNDLITGGAARDTINGGDDDDVLYGQGGLDEVNGDAGNDQLFGGVGNDLLSGGADNDTLAGQEGNDRIDGGTGSDELRGNAGIDTFVFADGYEDDDIINFNINDDLIELNADVLVGTGAFTVADVLNPVNGIATQTSATLVTLDFGGGDILTVGSPSGVTIADLSGLMFISIA